MPLDVNITIFQTLATAPIAELAVFLDESGYTGLYFTEHTHQTWEFSQSNPSLHSGFRESFDPFVSAQAALAVTDNLHSGSAVSLLAQREPIVTAKQLATLEQIFPGRLEIGVGAGWVEDEMRNHGVNPARRNAILGEHVRSMKALWTGKAVEFHGKYVDFPTIISHPTPATPGGPPIFIGGSGPKAIERIREFGDGWMPDYDPEQLTTYPQRIGALRELGEMRGQYIPILMTGVPADPHIISQLAEAGVDRIATLAPSADLSTIRQYIAPFALAVRDALGFSLAI